MFLDIATQRTAEEIKRGLPSMYHQFMKLANLDITKEPMEIGPTAHYIMGGIKVDPHTEMSTVTGLFAAGEVAAGLHGANRLGGNSLSDLVVFGQHAGAGAVEYVKRNSRNRSSMRRRWTRPSPSAWRFSSARTAKILTLCSATCRR